MLTCVHAPRMSMHAHACLIMPLHALSCPLDAHLCPCPNLHAYGRLPCMPIYVMPMPNEDLKCTLGAVCDHQDSA